MRTPRCKHRLGNIYIYIYIYIYIWARVKTCCTAISYGTQQPSPGYGEHDSRDSFATLAVAKPSLMSSLAAPRLRRTTTYYDVLRRSTTYYDVLRRITTYYDARRRTTTYYNVLQRITTYYDVLRRTAVYHDVPRRTTMYYDVL